MERLGQPLSQEDFDRNSAALEARQAAEIELARTRGQNARQETERRHHHELVALWLEHTGEDTKSDGHKEWLESSEGQQFIKGIRNGSLVKEYGQPEDTQGIGVEPRREPKRQSLDEMLGRAGITATTQPRRRRAGRGRSGR